MQRSRHWGRKSKPLNLSGGKMRKFNGLAVVSLVFILCSCGDVLSNAKIGNIERIQNGLEAGAPIEKRDHIGNTLLMIAAENKQYEALEYLYKKGANVNAQNNNGATALIMAAYYNHLDTAKILLKYNANKTIQDKYGNTAFDYAEQFGYIPMIAVLKN
jgi:ankyrin repeat protein